MRPLFIDQLRGKLALKIVLSIIGAILLLGTSETNAIEPVQAFRPSTTSGYAIGRMGETALAIPLKDVFLGVQYEGEDAWSKQEGPRPLRTFKSRIANFSLQLDWPGLATRPRMAMGFTPENKNWLAIGVQLRNSQARDPKLPFDPINAPNPWAKILQARLNNERGRLPSGVHFEVREGGGDDGLSVAVPLGPEADIFNLWNQAIYWHRSSPLHVDTYIECQNGKFKNGRTVRRCILQYSLSELRSDVSITFSADLLASWRQIVEETRRRILSFRRTT